MQRNQYFTIAAPFAQIIQRIEEYGRANPPSRRKVIRFVVEDPQPIWDGFERTHHFATAYCFSRWESGEPLFELSATETQDSCRVTLRCLDPRIQEWCEDLLDWLAPDWTSPDPQPLPEVPAVGGRPAASGTHAKPDAVTRAPAAQSPAAERAAEKKRSRGRPPLPDDYKKKQVEEYWKVRGEQTQKGFCLGKPFSERTLRAWIAWHFETWGEPG